MGGLGTWHFAILIKRLLTVFFRQCKILIRTPPCGQNAYIAPKGNLYLIPSSIFQNDRA